MTAVVDTLLVAAIALGIWAAAVLWGAFNLSAPGSTLVSRLGAIAFDTAHVFLPLIVLFAWMGAMGALDLPILMGLGGMVVLIVLLGPAMKGLRTVMKALPERVEWLSRPAQLAAELKSAQEVEKV